MDRLSELLGHHVQFVYTAWDRIVLNGYLERLQHTPALRFCVRRRGLLEMHCGAFHQPATSGTKYDSSAIAR